MRHATLLIAPLFAALTLAGCANTNKNDGQVSIATAENGQLFEGVACTVRNDAQSWDIVTPATLDIGEVNGELRIVCNKAGYVSADVRLAPGPSGSGSSGPSVNLGLGGASGGIGSIIGAGLGLTLPFGLSSSGGHYPPMITVDMTRQQDSQQNTAAQNQ